MPTLDERVQTLERRLSEWEGQIGFFIPHVQQLHREILRVDEKVDMLDTKVNMLDTKVNMLETKVDKGFAATLEQFIRVDKRFESLETKMDALPRILAEIVTPRK